MATDWQVGDLAVRVDDTPTGGPMVGLKLGHIYRVANITQTPVGLLRLWFEGVPHVNGAAARQFRKIRPDAHEACETEFVTLLKRSRVSA